MKTIVINARNSTPQGTDNSRFRYNFPQGGYAFRNDQVAVSNLSIYYSWNNITAANQNNTFSYVWYFGAIPTATTVNITVPDGFYTIPQLNAYLQSVMITQGHYLINATGDYVYFLELVENSALYSVQFNSYYLLTAAQAAALGYTAPGAWPGYVNVNITPQIIIPATNFRNLIGFNNGTYPSPTQVTNYSKTSDYTPQVTPITSVLVSCSLVNNPLALPSNIIYSFAPSDTSFGSLIVPTFSNFIWNDVTDGYWTGFDIQFLTPDFQALPMKDINIVMILSIKHKENQE